MLKGIGMLGWPCGEKWGLGQGTWDWDKAPAGVWAGVMGPGQGDGEWDVMTGTGTDDGDRDGMTGPGQGSCWGQENGDRKEVPARDEMMRTWTRNLLRTWRWDLG